MRLTLFSDHCISGLPLHASTLEPIDRNRFQMFSEGTSKQHQRLLCKIYREDGPFCASDRHDLFEERVCQHSNRWFGDRSERLKRKATDCTPDCVERQFGPGG